MPSPAVSLRGVSKKFTSNRGEAPVSAVEDLTLDIEDGEFFSLLGPSGCGKTTTLRMIAGFEEPTVGEVLIDGQNVAGRPPFHRPVNTVFQDYALFPHMTVWKNIAFGLEMERVPRPEIQKRVQNMLEIVQLPGMGQRYPRQLSGGQQQRVALARALIKEPKVLLLDEPLGALDLKLRKQMQLELKHMQRQFGITFIYVTHDQEEALAMSDRIGVMNKGRLLQVGAPGQIYDFPANRFVADFIGETNFLEGRISERGPESATVVIGDQWPLHVTAPHNGAKPGDLVTVAVRPEKIELRPATDDSANALPGNIEEELFVGTDTRYVITLPNGSQLVARLQNGITNPAQQYAPGDHVKVLCSPQHTLILTG